MSNNFDTGKPLKSPSVGSHCSQCHVLFDTKVHRVIIRPGGNLCGECSDAIKKAVELSDQLHGVTPIEQEQRNLDRALRVNRAILTRK